MKEAWQNGYGTRTVSADLIMSRVCGFDSRRFLATARQKWFTIKGAGWT